VLLLLLLLLLLTVGPPPLIQPCPAMQRLLWVKQQL
jgi:hypothetical protein